MQIKSTSSSSSGRRGRRRAIVLATALAMSLLCMTIYQVGWREKDVLKFVSDASASIKTIPENLLGESAAPPSAALPIQLEHIEIFLKPEALKKLHMKRQQAMTIYFLEKSTDDFVPAIVTHNGKEYEVRMRLKGDFVDHLEKEKWSFRIEVKGDNTIMGMKRFSIQHPKTRSYLYEWVYFNLLRHEGLIALRYDFITASLNGRPLGIYAIEEHFEKRLIENNSRRDGPIVRLNEDLSWWARVNRLEEFGAEVEESHPDTFYTSEWMKDPALRDIHNRALNLMESFRAGTVNTSGAFDIEQLARFYGVCEVMGNDHSRVWNNLRYYYNPVTAKFEPVGYDAYAGFRSKPLVIGDIRAFPYDRMFADSKFMEAYMRTLRRMADPKYLEEFYAKITPELDRLEATLLTEWPKDPHAKFDRQLLWDNQNHFRKALNPFKALHVYFREYDNESRSLALEIGNILPVPIIVTGAKWGQTEFNLPKPITIPCKYRFEPMQYQTVRFDAPAGFSPDSLDAEITPKVVYHMIGLAEKNEVESFAWAQEPGYLGPELLARQQPTMTNFPFISVDENAKLVSIIPGEHRITSDLIIPEGYTVVCGEGTILDLCNSALIFSYSPLEWAGAINNPIAVTTSDGTGQGLVVIQPNKQSRLTHVVFNKLRFPDRKGWKLTGGVTFYEAKLDMQNCSFDRIQAEDGLNLIRCDFEFKNVRWEFCKSDAFDADFCKGEFNECYFLQPGNDAIDVSGSWVTVKATLIDAALDKGLSSGERSVLHAFNVTLNRCEIAMAAKDMSEIGGDDNLIKNSKVGLTAYRKKPEFGPGQFNLTRTKFENVAVQHLIEQDSEMIMDGTMTKGELTNVEAMLYGAQFGKASDR